LGAIVALAAAVRLACSFNDLWLDEIWSLRLVAQISSPVQILTRLTHDNNHPLNSLFLYLLLPARAGWTYRLFSWFTGSAAVALAGVLAGRQFRLLHPRAPASQVTAAVLFTAALFGGCYLLIHYSSEARGYAPAVCFSLLAFYALLRGPARAWSVWVFVYWTASALALLSHLASVQVLFAGVAWTAARVLPEPVTRRDRLVELTRWHLVPGVAFGLYYWGFVNKLGVGGGHETGLVASLGDLAAYSLGFPAAIGVLAALPALLLVIFVALCLIGREGNRAPAWFYATAIFVAPALGLGSGRFVLFYPRYFIVSAACALLLAGYALARLWTPRRAGRIAGLALVAAFLAGNGGHVARLIAYGRGQYQPALRYIAANTATAVITVSSDNDFRNLTVIDYYGAALGAGRKVTFYGSNGWPAGGPQWLFLHRLDGVAPPVADIFAANGLHFRLERRFPHAALSGWDWFVYRNVTLLP